MNHTELQQNHNESFVFFSTSHRSDTEHKHINQNQGSIINTIHTTSRLSHSHANKERDKGEEWRTTPTLSCIKTGQRSSQFTCKFDQKENGQHTRFAPMLRALAVTGLHHSNHLFQHCKIATKFWRIITSSVRRFVKENLFVPHFNI